MAVRKYPSLFNPVSFSLAAFLSVFATAAAHAQTYTLTTIASFNGANSGAHPQSNLVFDKRGNLYGTTSGGDGDKDGTVFKIDSETHALTTMAAFEGANGALPCGALAIDKNGNLYGTTQQGGLQKGVSVFGVVGSVFKVAAGAKTITTLASFNGNSVPGFFPEGLSLDKSGNLYGTTPFTQLGPGTLFKIASGTNAFTALAQFDFKAGEHSPAVRNNPATVASLEGMVCPGVTVDSAGNLYGTVASSNSFPHGFVYEIKAATNTPVILAAFDGPNGWRPNGYLALDSHGNLYGTTKEGGEHEMGTVFKVASGTHQIMTLASFDGKNGSSPETGVIVDRAGNLYGTARISPSVSDAEPSRVPSIQLAYKTGSGSTGTIFKIATGTRTITTLARFDGMLSDFPTAFPKAGLAMDDKGNIYGAVNAGGPSGDGIVFKLTRREASRFRKSHASMPEASPPRP